MWEIHVVKFFTRTYKHFTLRQRDRRQVWCKQIELITRQGGQQFVVQRTAQIGSVHRRLSPGRSGRLPQGIGDAPRGRSYGTYVKDLKSRDVCPLPVIGGGAGEGQLAGVGPQAPKVRMREPSNVRSLTFILKTSER